MEDPQPQHVVGDPPPNAGLLQVVVRLQHCNYTFVNDPLKILFSEAALTPKIVPSPYGPSPVDWKWTTMWISESFWGNPVFSSG